MSDAAGSSSGKLKKMNVLFADSDALLIKTHQTLLEDKFDMDVQTAANGNEVVSAYRDGSTYDLLFLDQNLPTLDGAEVTKTLRKMKVKSKIVGLYDEFDEDEVDAFIKAGLDVCIKKPLNEEKVKAILLNTVDKKSK